MEPTDQELLGRAAAGDEEAFVSLYRRRQAGIYRFGLQMSGSEVVAEDATQEVFLALMRDAAGHNPERGSVAAYLYGIARNQVRRCFERRVEPLDESLASAEDIHGELARSRSIEAVRVAAAPDVLAAGEEATRRGVLFGRQGGVRAAREDRTGGAAGGHDSAQLGACLLA